VYYLGEANKDLGIRSSFSFWATGPVRIYLADRRIGYRYSIVVGTNKWILTVGATNPLLSRIVRRENWLLASWEYATYW
jgi:hypothetical protein